MIPGQTDHIGKKLKAIRQELSLNQEDWAKLLQVTTNTVARWERGELMPKGAHRKKVEQVVAISQDQKAIDVIKNALKSDGGLPAAAAFIGMLFGVLGVMGASLSVVGPILRSKSNLLKGIREYTGGDRSGTDE